MQLIIINGQEITLDIHDSPGQERFQVPIENYEIFDGIVLVCDIKEEVVESYKIVKNYWNQIKEKVKKNVSVILLENKKDMQGKAKASNEINKLKKELGIKCFEVSPETGEGIQRAFETLAVSMMYMNDLIKIEKKKKKTKNQNRNQQPQK